ncbi:MAG: hypothetical protein ACKOXZ_03095, partial [Polynucleobacter victoriensis]
MKKGGNFSMSSSLSRLASFLFFDFLRACASFLSLPNTWRLDKIRKMQRREENQRTKSLLNVRGT